MSKFELKNKIAVVTGVGEIDLGIGSCIAMAYVKAGADVVVVGRDPESLDAVAAEVKDLGRRSIAVVTDVTVPDQVDDLVKMVLNTFGRIDILANSAGCLPLGKEEVLSSDVWVDHLALNLNATFFCSAAVGKVMVEQEGGKIVNISSASALKGEALHPAYAASKAGVISLTKSLALRWAQYNINVNSIAPGRVADKDASKAPGAAPPLTLPAKPEDIANAAVFFASEGSDRITGETLVVRGSEWASVYF